MKTMKLTSNAIIALTLLVLGIILAVGPWVLFPICEVEGMLQPNGLPMPCGFTARAEMVAGSLLFIGGLLLFFAKSNETKRVIAILSTAIGVWSVLIPVYLIGVCKNLDHPCVLETKPSLLIVGAAVVIVSLVLLYMTRKKM